MEEIEIWLKGRDEPFAYFIDGAKIVTQDGFVIIRDSDDRLRALVDRESVELIYCGGAK